MEKYFKILGVCLLLSGVGFLAHSTNRIANSLEYGEQQARKLEPAINMAKQQLDLMLPETI